MHTRSSLAVLAVAALVVTPAAQANTKSQSKNNAKSKPKVYCKVLTDKAGDGKSNLSPAVTSKGLDILSADIATGATTMVAVLRLGDTNFSVTHDPWAAPGYYWDFATTASTAQSYVFSATRNVDGTVTAGAAVDGSKVTLKSFHIDTTRNTFTWVVDRSVDKMLTQQHIVFKTFRARSEALGATADTAPDQAPTSNTYPDRASSCVPAR
jgi:hypothetical protein